MPNHTIFNERPESQNRALKVIEKLGYTIVPRSEAEKKRGSRRAVLFTEELQSFLSHQTYQFGTEERYFSGGSIAKAMQNYCGGVKCEALLREGLDLLKSFETEIVPRLFASNPHELMRTHEVLDILTVAQIVLRASLERKASSEPLCFRRGDYPEMEKEEERRHIVIRQEDGAVCTRDVPLDFFGDLREEYEKRNGDYIREREDAGYEKG